MENMDNITSTTTEDLEWTRLLQDMGHHIGGLPTVIKDGIMDYLGEMSYISNTQ